MTMPVSVTALILTHNEEQHIERCINSLSGVVEDIVVVDSFSQDRTVEIAEKLGARVFENPWTNYATQFQWGLDNAEIETDWVFRIDADEYLEQEGKSNLNHLAHLPNDTTGIYIRRKYFFMGKWIKHGTMYPINHLRIWRRGKGRIESRWMDEHIVLNGGNTQQIDIDIVDDNLNSVSWWIDKHNGYASREMLDLLNERYSFLEKDNAIKQIKGDKQARIKRVLKEDVYAKLPIFVRPLLYFLYRYFIRLGFLDGAKGFAFHFMQGLWYRSLVDLKMFESRSWLSNVDPNDKNAIKKILSEKTGLRIE